MKRILVGVDGSKESLQAALLAANLAHETHRDLEIAHVLPQAQPLGPGAAYAAELAVWRKDIATRGNALIHEVEERVARPETNARTTMVESSTPAEAMAELAKDPDVDLVVVGHRGRNSLTRVLLGSVADRLVQICPKPVLVVR